jgi:hypothetical protein
MPSVLAVIIKDSVRRPGQHPGTGTIGPILLKLFILACEYDWTGLLEIGDKAIEIKRIK